MYSLLCLFLFIKQIKALLLYLSIIPFDKDLSELQIWNSVKQLDSEFSGK